MKTEAEYAFYDDIREKKNVSFSARKKRTHCGKGGRVRLPSDNLSKKEFEKMNGECEVYRLNEPMKWAEFIAMPTEHQITYINKLREKFNVPDARIARMLCVSQGSFSLYVRKLGLGVGKRCSHTAWDMDGWYVFTQGIEIPKIETVHASDTAPEIVDEPQATHFDLAAEEIAPTEHQTVSLDDFAHLEDVECYETVKVELEPVPFVEDKSVPAFEDAEMPLIPITPCSGTMSFEGKFEDVLKAVGVLIGSASGKIHIAWDVA